MSIDISIGIHIESRFKLFRPVAQISSKTEKFRVSDIWRMMQLKAKVQFYALPSRTCAPEILFGPMLRRRWVEKYGEESGCQSGARIGV
jgi:hypothetical protein